MAAKDVKDEPGVKVKTEDFKNWELEPDEFIIDVTLAGKDILGLDVDWGDGKTLYIKGVKPGIVKEWNRTHPVDSVQSGDRVIAINGVADDPQAMLGVCRNRGRLKLLIRSKADRATRIAQAKKAQAAAEQAVEMQPPSLESLVTLDTQGQPLGIDVDWADGKTLYIRATQPGAVEEWNKSRGNNEAMVAGCVIVAVNGVSADPHAMLQQCKSNRKLQLLLREPPRPPRGPPPARQASGSPDRKRRR
eukprot:TRINITY_DN2020_c0_g1_i1.p2 TRINITY_DN2020_c0_g1~~TRINITY_DN2020_c0_g1_i1.p2  ORF type:complete len:247 (-),score=67.09 TRINITY_DN2020_c0_g1_i1:58-798(-)